MEIGTKIKELRVLKGLTQEELADRAELSKGFISQLERDLTSPSIATLMDIHPREKHILLPAKPAYQRHRIQKRDQMDHSQCPEKCDGAHTPHPEGRRLHLPG